MEHACQATRRQSPPVAIGACDMRCSQYSVLQALQMYRVFEPFPVLCLQEVCTAAVPIV